MFSLLPHVNGSIWNTHKNFLIYSEGVIFSGRSGLRLSPPTARNWAYTVLKKNVYRGILRSVGFISTSYIIFFTFYSVTANSYACFDPISAKLCAFLLSQFLMFFIGNLLCFIWSKSVYFFNYSDRITYSRHNFVCLLLFNFWVMLSLTKIPFKSPWGLKPLIKLFTLLFKNLSFYLDNSDLKHNFSLFSLLMQLTVDIKSSYNLASYFLPWPHLVKFLVTITIVIVVIGYIIISSTGFESAVKV